MALSRRGIRQTVGKDLGIIKVGVATAVDSTNDDDLTDTSDDSPLDPGDAATLLSGAGLLVVDPDNSTGALAYRRNITYTPSSQNLSFATLTTLAGTPIYEIHLEPLLHPLTDWPDLIDDGLALIRRISFQHILLNNRRYYDLSQYADILGPEMVRRLYFMGPNLLRNASFDQWATGDDGPGDWTASAALARVEVVNYAQAAQCGTTETLYQDITGLGAQGRRLKVVVWGKAAATATGTLRVTARLADDSTERETTDTVAASKTERLEVEIETTPRTASIRIKLEAATANVDWWAPMVYEMSAGRRQRVKPLTTMLSDGEMKMWVPPKTGVGQMALLLPYAALGAVATDAADLVTTAAPDELIVSAVAMQVLRWLTQSPQIPSSSKQEYLASLMIWEARFQQRARIHMRKIAKTQELWESGELA